MAVIHELFPINRRHQGLATPLDNGDYEASEKLKVSNQ